MEERKHLFGKQIPRLPRVQTDSQKPSCEMRRISDMEAEAEEFVHAKPLVILEGSKISGESVKRRILHRGKEVVVKFKDHLDILSFKSDEPQQRQDERSVRRREMKEDVSFSSPSSESEMQPLHFENKAGVSTFSSEVEGETEKVSESFKRGVSSPRRSSRVKDKKRQRLI